MARYRLSRLAARDLAEIADYTINTFGIAQARQYRDGLHDCFQKLANKPELGRDASELAPRLKRYAYQSHMIFYTVQDKSITIIRVLHQRMDFKRHL